MAVTAQDRQTQTIAYEEAYAGFREEALAEHFAGDFNGGINACVECCDRHASGGAIALEYESAGGERASATFEELKEKAARFAKFLQTQGIKPGDVISGMLPRTVEILITILGAWRAGAVYQPLFTAFGPKAIEHRLQFANSRLVVTDSANRPKLDEVATPPPVLVVASPDETAPLSKTDLDFRGELARQSPRFEPVMRTGDDLFLMMSTSGTTGPAKGVPVPLRALKSFLAYMLYAVDLRPDDRFWNIADPGWAYGLYYAVTGPLMLGHTTTFYNGPFTVESTYRIIKTHGITNLAGAPTAYRMMIAAGPQAAAEVKGQLRVVSSAGEPLNPEVIRWFAKHLSVPIYDHYGQTETGMIVNNHHRLHHPVHPGSAGLAMPGYRVAVLNAEGRELGPNVSGVLAVDITRSPLYWFTGYWQQPTPAIDRGYYLTGDVVELEPEGHISFVSRADDVITSSGYRIGPFDVESALIEHPAVMEAAVIGKPDPERTEIVKAFVVLKAGFEPSDTLAEDLRQFVKRRLSAHAYPREIAFVPQLPKTPSGKLQRFILRNMEKAAMGQTAAKSAEVRG